jgi:hypothetical protein
LTQLILSEYSLALAFDQLRNIMQNGHDFDGFREAPINFSPTYKYDVLRTIKRPKKKRRGWTRSTEKLDGLYEVEGKETGEGEEEDEVSLELVSDVSTIATPGQVVKPATEAEGEYFMADNKTSADVPLVQNGAKLSKRASLRLLAPKWISKWRASKSRSSHRLIPLSETSKLPISVHSSPEIGNPKQATPPPRSLSALSQKGDMAHNEFCDGMDRGIYDSSSKQRVPSWWVILEMVVVFGLKPFFRLQV